MLQNCLGERGPIQDQFYIISNFFQGMKNYNIKVAILLTDGLVCLCRSYRDISLKLRLLHNQLKVHCSRFNLCVHMHSIYIALDKRHSQMQCPYVTGVRCYLMFNKPHLSLGIFPIIHLNAHVTENNNIKKKQEFSYRPVRSQTGIAGQLHSC